MSGQVDQHQPPRAPGFAPAALLLWLALTGLACALALILFEVIMQAREPGPVMRVSPATYGEFDERLGVHYAPDTQLSFAYVDGGGRVLDCIEGLSRTNRDGLRGQDTLQDHDAPSVRVRLIASGDSFSHWNNAGMTVVDHVRVNLQAGRPAGQAVSVLNVAGGTFGLQHMLVHLADQLDRLRQPPQAVVLPFIGDDITRGWWHVRTERDAAGRVRPRIAAAPACLAVDSGCGADEYLVVPRATQAWCRAQLAGAPQDEVNAAILAQYRDIAGFRFVHLRRVARQLGLPLHDHSVIPRLASPDDVDWQRVDAAVARIRRSQAKLFMVYLPLEAEIRKRRIELDPLQKTLLSRFEERLSTKTLFPGDFAEFRSISQFAISSVDPHPSVALQQAYGAYLAAFLRPYLH